MKCSLQALRFGNSIPKISKKKFQKNSQNFQKITSNSRNQIPKSYCLVRWLPFENPEPISLLVSNKKA